MEFDYKPLFSITSEMLDLVVEITEHLTKLSPLNNLLKLPQLRRINRLKTIHSSCAIEGNTLTLDQVSAVIEGKTVIAPKNEILEVKNAFEAYKLLEKINPYDMKDMLKIHSIMMDGLMDDSGKFRTKNVGVFDGDKPIHVAPPPANVHSLVEMLFQWLKTDKINELIKASIFHYEFEVIHPFNDGNGRLGRFMQTALLAKWKPIFTYIPVESIIKDKQQEYYTAFRQCSADNGSSNHFVTFMLKVILDAVRNIHNDTGNLIKSQTTQIQNLLEVMEHTPLSAKEIASRLNLKSIVGLKKNYLDPALKLGVIAMTLPDKPTSKNQKYYKP